MIYMRNITITTAKSATYLENVGEERRVSFYSNVITARHEIGHRRGSNITVAEVREGHAAANHILDVLKSCFAARGPVPQQAQPAAQCP
jgi:hypothetical protein